MWSRVKRQASGSSALGDLHATFFSTITTSIVLALSQLAMAYDQQAQASLQSASGSRQAAAAASAAPASSPSSKARAAAEAAMTPTQRTIQALLKVDATPSATDAFFALMKLECRPLPTTIATHQLLPANHPRCCCFDASSGSLRSWTAHRICVRCGLLNRLLQSEFPPCMRCQGEVAPEGRGGKAQGERGKRVSSKQSTPCIGRARSS